MSHSNVNDADIEYDPTDPPGYKSGMATVGKLAGGKELNIKLYELPTGESLCPYHYEYVEEWVLVLDGNVTVRVPDGSEDLEPGDLMCFPRGAQGAHKVSNSGDKSARVIMFSSAQEPAVAVYPDSDKIGVWPGDARDKVMLRRSDGNVDYWDGEV
jgi:uncharacterized cupin superfamily protein